MIETERLILRPFIESDYKDVFEYLNEPMQYSKKNGNHKSSEVKI